MNEIENICRVMFGSVMYKGKELTLTQSPYFSGEDDSQHYLSHATDNEENNYLVTWDVKDEYLQVDEDNNSFDESDMCDWEKFRVRSI